MKVLKSAIR